MNEQTWAQWWRSNTDKFLLLFAFYGCIAFVLHVSHEGAMDKDLLSWGRELGSGFAAAFLTMVTGSLMRQSSTAPPQNLPPGSTATTQIKTVTPPASAEASPSEAPTAPESRTSLSRGNPPV